MEKLIKLLSEYDKLLPGWRLVYNPEYKCFYCHIKGDALVSNRYHVGQVISKDFGFIKWLYDNHKISMGKVNNYVMAGCWDFNGIDDFDSVLMVLSIQDSPVEFLCEILR